MMLLGTVAFAWYVKRSIGTEDDRPLARAAIAIASFPSDVKNVFIEIRRLASGAQNFDAIRAFPPDRPETDFSAVTSSIAGAGEGLVVHHGPGIPARGWRVIGGVMQVNGSLQNAAVLLSPDLEIVHVWPLAEDGLIDQRVEHPWRINLHGFGLLKDGSVIYTFDAGHSLHRKDKCGRTMWALAGRYHHTVTLDDTQSTAWAFRTDPEGDPGLNSKLLQVATADGRIIREITTAAIIAANPEIDILELRRLHPKDFGGNAAGLTGKWLEESVHLNDIDPLPRDLADKFPMFAPGDLLISARELNLIFVMDPETLKVKWWRVGATIRQHDGDWNKDGQISMLNNRTGRGYSEIVKMDPATLATTVAVDGRAIDFYTRYRGSHQPLPDGGFLIASTHQGRIIEIAPDGQVALEFRNRTREKGLAYTILSVGTFFPEEALKAGDFQCGEN